MKSKIIILLAIFLMTFAGKSFTKTLKQEGNILADDKNVVVKFETTMGNFKVKLFIDKAPITASNFLNLVEQGFFDGIIFHRVIDGFMIQGGDPTGTGRGGSKKIIRDEFGEGLKHDRKGILSMANAGPNTGSSQFFITLVPTPWLDGKYAIFGEVIEGMEIVEKIGKTPVGPGDKPITEVKMIKLIIENGNYFSQIPFDLDKELEKFKEKAETYKNLNPKPEISEDVRKFYVQATTFSKDKKYKEAIDMYEKIFELDETFPDAHFNVALLHAQVENYESAILEMKKYLLLVPEAKDARAAQDKIYEWEAKIEK